MGLNSGTAVMKKYVQVFHSLDSSLFLRINPAFFIRTMVWYQSIPAAGKEEPEWE